MCKFKQIDALQGFAKSTKYLIYRIEDRIDDIRWCFMDLLFDFLEQIQDWGESIYDFLFPRPTHLTKEQIDLLSAITNKLLK